MADSSPERTLTRTAKVPPTVQLVNWPLRDEGLRAWLMLALIVAASAAAGGVAGSWTVAGLVLAALAVSAWRLWLPIAFEVGPKGVVQTVLGRRWRVSWDELVRCQTRRHGVLLLADSEPAPLAALRGIYVPCKDAGQRDALVEAIDFYLQESPSPQAQTRA